MNKVAPEGITFAVSTDEGSYDLEASIQLIGQDLLIAVWGGDRPHIGAVSGAQTQPSVANPATINATASVLCFPGHKEDRLVKPIAEKIARVTGRHVVVTAGAHWNKIDSEGIEKVLCNGDILAGMILEKLAACSDKGDEET
jgi:hypothetical protein